MKPLPMNRELTHRSLTNVVFQEKKWKIASQESNFSRILTYNESGLADFESEIEEYENAFFRMTQEAGELVTDNIQDKTIREGLMHVGWKPDQRDYPAAADAVEWWLYDGEQAYTPEETSLVFNSVRGVPKYTSPFPYYGFI